MVVGGDSRSSIWTSRASVVKDLLDYGESEVALEIGGLSEERWREIGTRAFDLALVHGLLAKALALAAVEIVEGRPRELRRQRRRFSRE
jgi:hypothetical protein